MITPYWTDYYFEMNPEADIRFEDDVIYIENVYKNYDDLYELLINSPAPNWKCDSNTRNFKDYYDCRHSWPFPSPYKPNWNATNLVLANLIKRFYNCSDKVMVRGATVNINVFKHIELPPAYMQHNPHRDAPFAAITFLDKVSNGGTAIYEPRQDIPYTQNTELMHDTTDIPLVKVIQSKPNRMVIFRSSQWHGGYISDHTKYLNDWRINEVKFFEPREN